MFQGFDSGSPSSIDKRTHLGWHTGVTRKGPSQWGGGELVGTFPAKGPSEHHIFQLELSAAHKLFVVALKCLPVPCIFNSRLPSSLINQVDIFTPKLVLRGFIVHLDMERAHGDLRGEDGLSPYTMKKGVSPVA
jgi:hypothetical protein